MYLLHVKATNILSELEKEEKEYTYKQEAEIL
jgi:hypothetical protein